jgi:hypothetical protein
MTWAKKHPVEVAAEWVAPALLAAAASWAATAMGLPLPAVGAVGAIALTAAVLALRLAGGASGLSDPGFEPVPIEIAAGEMGELLLDDPLVEMAPDSRVVRLFAGAEPTPGELVLRIEDYLNGSRRTPDPAIHETQQGPTDASAALNAALANIRATLR